MNELHYRILDLSVSLSCDCEELLSRFDADYGWFRVGSPAPGKGLAFAIRLQDGKGPFFEMVRRYPYASHTPDSLLPATEKHSLFGYPKPVNWSLQRIVNAVFQETEEFLMLHAGVVEYKGSALVLSGAPGAGKTTTVLELLKRGFRFMSDDGCPVHRETGHVHPFPRRAWVAQSGREQGSSLRVEKSPLPLESLPSELFGEPLPIGWVFCLESGVSHSDEEEVRIDLRRGTGEALLEALGTLAGVRLHITGEGNRGVRVRYPRNQGLTGKIRHLLHQHRTTMWAAYQWKRARPDFHAKPGLKPISTHEGIFHLMHHMKAADTDVGTGSAAGLFWECAALVGNAPVWRVQAGELNETIDRIVEIVEAPWAKRAVCQVVAKKTACS